MAEKRTDDLEAFNANPTGKAKNGLSIYELAAMQANPDAIPNNANDDDQDDGERVECRSCGRKFRSAAIGKHEGICKKVFINKRKEFNIKEQRKADGIQDIEQEKKYTKPFGKKQPAKPAMAEVQRPGANIPKWKL